MQLSEFLGPVYWQELGLDPANPIFRIPFTPRSLLETPEGGGGLAVILGSDRERVLYQHSITVIARTVNGDAWLRTLVASCLANSYVITLDPKGSATVTINGKDGADRLIGSVMHRLYHDTLRYLPDRFRTMLATLPTVEELTGMVERGSEMHLLAVATSFADVATEVQAMPSGDAVQSAGSTIMLKGITIPTFGSRRVVLRCSCVACLAAADDSAELTIHDVMGLMKDAGELKTRRPQVTVEVAAYQLPLPMPVGITHADPFFMLATDIVYKAATRLLPEIETPQIIAATQQALQSQAGRKTTGGGAEA